MAICALVRVARDAKGNPDPRLVILDGEPINSKGGTFCLDFGHHGKRRQEAVRMVPRDSLHAWMTKLAIFGGSTEPEEAEQVRMIDEAVQNYPVEVEATNSRNTFQQDGQAEALILCQRSEAEAARPGFSLDRVRKREVAMLARLPIFAEEQKSELTFVPGSDNPQSSAQW